MITLVAGYTDHHFEILFDLLINLRRDATKSLSLWKHNLSFNRSIRDTGSQANQTCYSKASGGTVKPACTACDRVVLHNPIHAGCLRWLTNPGCLGEEAVSIRCYKVSR